MSPHLSTAALHLTLPQGYGYVALGALGTCFLTIFQSLLVSKARKASGVKYPQMYADEKEAKVDAKKNKFNCCQRAHQNTLETLPLFLLTLLISGLRHPRLAVGLGATWLVGRVLYTVGYASGDPAKRMQGGLPSSLSYIGLVITATTTVVQFLSEGDWKI
ncbi:membrane-associated proteins in eicosanoid and glutathione metabolism [Jaminaea rosea]|uniref:Glutathione S-transferase 3, mitochondrial n=1 Tax=Jaminaea rosea TaxID=1569628 RepID=A0A316V1H0_9BASI|nr:membrane-associated proteins in eicosanoid and glutathione metabolism [Jaminaea rosea]PWN29255.1 membrane-associated proteins in eicosanoid and glutathione metabolism [Jaminaea rosea]